MWKHTKLRPWFNRNKEHWFFKTFENAKWFPWYGRNLVHVKPKEMSKLSDIELAIKVAINKQDYEKALELVKTLPDTPKRESMQQYIENKL
jgi:hypothetical protein